MRKFKKKMIKFVLCVFCLSSFSILEKDVLKVSIVLIDEGLDEDLSDYAIKKLPKSTGIAFNSLEPKNLEKAEKARKKGLDIFYLSRLGVLKNNIGNSGVNSIWPETSKEKVKRRIVKSLLGLKTNKIIFWHGSAFNSQKSYANINSAISNLSITPLILNKSIYFIKHKNQKFASTNIKKGEKFVNKLESAYRERLITPNNILVGILTREGVDEIAMWSSKNKGYIKILEV